LGIRDIENSGSEEKAFFVLAHFYIEMRKKLSFFLSFSPSAFLKAADGHLIDVCFESEQNGTEPPFSSFFLQEERQSAALSQAHFKADQ
jgi:hypothetical protein